MEEKAHVGYDDVVDVGEKFVGGVVAKFSGAKGIEASDFAKQPAFLGELFVDQGGQGAEGHEPGPLDVVHLLDKLYMIAVQYQWQVDNI